MIRRSAATPTDYRSSSLDQLHRCFSKSFWRPVEDGHAVDQARYSGIRAGDDGQVGKPSQERNEAYHLQWITRPAVDAYQVYACRRQSLNKLFRADPHHSAKSSVHWVKGKGTGYSNLTDCTHRCHSALCLSQIRHGLYKDRVHATGDERFSLLDEHIDHLPHADLPERLDEPPCRPNRAKNRTGVPGDALRDTRSCEVDVSSALIQSITGQLQPAAAKRIGYDHIASSADIGSRDTGNSLGIREIESLRGVACSPPARLKKRAPGAVKEHVRALGQQ